MISEHAEAGGVNFGPLVRPLESWTRIELRLLKW